MVMDEGCRLCHTLLFCMFLERACTKVGVRRYSSHVCMFSSVLLRCDSSSSNCLEWRVYMIEASGSFAEEAEKGRMGWRETSVTYVTSPLMACE